MLVRVAYRCCYAVGLVTGTVAARLASDFRVLGGAGRFAVVLQVPVLACWMLARPISLAAFEGCFALAPRLGSTR